MTEKKQTLTINCTPTWRGVLPILLAAYADGSPAGRAAASEELARMADLADAYVASRPKPLGEVLDATENVGS